MIHSATRADLIDVAQVQVSSWRSTYVGLVPRSYLAELSVEDMEVAWQEGFNEDLCAVFLWREGKTVQSFVSVGPCRDNDRDVSMVGEVYAVYVLESAQGRGIGTALFGRAFSWLRERGYREATVLVLEGNISAQRFYAKIGLVRDGFVLPESIGGQPVNEIRYWCEI